MYTFLENWLKVSFHYIFLYFGLYWIIVDRFNFSEFWTRTLLLTEIFSFPNYTLQLYKYNTEKYTWIIYPKYSALCGFITSYCCCPFYILLRPLLFVVLPSTKYKTSTVFKFMQSSLCSILYEKIFEEFQETL